MTPQALRALLPRQALAGIYHLPRSGITPVQDVAHALGYAFHHVDLGAQRTLEAALRHLGNTLGFPQWYGGNLDALYDCLTDSSCHEAPGHVLILSGADSLYAQRESFERLNQVLGDSIAARRTQGIPFWVFYDVHADGLATLPTVA